MFGYVKIYKDELKVKDYNLFRAYYCGLCRALGKSCSQSARLGLSYDMVFLAILLSALKKEEETFSEKPCIAHPFHKRKSVEMTEVMSYCSHMSVILGYLKLKDDFADSKSLKALMGMIIYFAPFKKSKKKYPEKYSALQEQMKRLASLEKENSDGIDIVADCFAKMLEELFCPSFEKENKRALGWLGYNMGRWIYIIDAFEDMEKDFKGKAYNPFLTDVKTEEELKVKKAQLAEKLSVTLTFTLENASGAFELLKIYKNEEILKNILYLSLNLTQEQILKAGRNEKSDESL